MPLRSWNDLTQEIHLPTDFAAAVGSGRPELARLINRPLTAEETQAVARAMAVLIETNQELQKHASKQVELIKDTIRSHLRGINKKMNELLDVAEFREPTDDINGD